MIRQHVLPPAGFATISVKHTSWFTDTNAIVVGVKDKVLMRGDAL
jgi:hypothetical protein